MALRTMLLCLLAAGCAQWHAQPLTPQQVVAEMHPKRIRVTLTDSSVLLLKHPVTSGDSIAGMVHGKRSAVPMDRIARADVTPQDAAVDFTLLGGWHTERRTPQQVIAKKHPERIRVTLSDSSVLELRYPVILGDSVIGLVTGNRTAVASDRIARTEIRVQSVLMMMGFISAYALVHSWACSQGSSPDCPGH
jgi:hypothetical protein